MPFDLQPTLNGRLVELRPLRPDDFNALFAVAADPLIWEQHPANNRFEEAVFREFFREALESGGALIAFDAKTGQVIGSSRFHGYDPDRDEVEIGWTFLSRSHWGGVYNGEMKQLMLFHAFRFVARVIFLIGPNNLRSQRAVEKIGAVRAGSRHDAGGRESYLFDITAATLMSQIKIRQAESADVADVAAILTEAARWVENRGIGMWLADEIAPDAIAKEVDAGLFFLAEHCSQPAGTIKFQLTDQLFWPDLHTSDSVFVHRLAIRRAFAGGAVSTALLAWAAGRAVRLGRRFLRLDCDASRSRLRAVYERFGFRYHSDRRVGPYLVARYELDLSGLPKS